MTVTTFSFTTGATVSSWTVPNHTGLVTITAIGGGGGGVSARSVGGSGARLAGTCTLTPGTVLTIIEGGAGGWGSGSTGGGGGGPTGWEGGQGGIQFGARAGGGGGASAVDTPGGVLIVAGGGGGGNSIDYNDNGYDGGGGPRSGTQPGHPGQSIGTGDRTGGGGGGWRGGGGRSGGSNFVDTARMTSIAPPGFGAAGVTITLDYTGPWVPPPPAGWSVGFLKF